MFKTLKFYSKNETLLNNLRSNSNSRIGTETKSSNNLRNSNELFKNKIETSKKEIKNVVSNQLPVTNENNEIFNIKRKSNIDINDNKVRSKLNTSNPNNYELKHISKASRNKNQSKPKYNGFNEQNSEPQGSNRFENKRKKFNRNPYKS